MDSKILKIRDKLIAFGLAIPDQIMGCNENEISDLEKELKLKLPEVYKDFLRLMGYKSGKFFFWNRYSFSMGFS